MPPVISQNLDIILAGSAIVALLVIYTVIKKSKSKPLHDELE